MLGNFDILMGKQKLASKCPTWKVIPKKVCPSLYPPFNTAKEQLCVGDITEIERSVQI